MTEFTITLDAMQERALEAITTQHNQLHNANLSLEDYFHLKATEYLNILVRQYREALKVQMEQKFDQLTPQQQAQILQQLGISIG